MACLLVVVFVAMVVFVDCVVGMVVMIVLFGGLAGVLVVLDDMVVLGVIVIFRVLAFFPRVWSDCEFFWVLLHYPRTCLGIRSLSVFCVFGVVGDVFVL